MLINGNMETLRVDIAVQLTRDVTPGQPYRE
jgi:hypothetical protein